MANQYYDVRVDVAKSDVFDSGLRFTQGDSKVIFLRIAVTNGGAKFDASNTTPSVNFVKPDGTYVVGTPVESNDVWVYQFLGNELQAAGKVLCDIKFTYSSGRISSGKFVFFVEKDTTIPEAQISQSYIAPMEEALAEMYNYNQQGKSIVDASREFSKDSEAWAAGTRDGIDIPDTDPQYHNNAKYWAEQAAASSGVAPATPDRLGIVMPDNVTINVDENGVLSAVGTGQGDMLSEVYDPEGEVADAGGIVAYVADELSGKQDTLTFDNVPTAESDNPVKSQGIKEAIDTALETSGELLKDTVGWTGKNLCSWGLQGTYTKNDGTLTVNADGSFTINGTFSANTQGFGANVRVPLSQLGLEVGKQYIMSGSGRSDIMFFLNGASENLGEAKLTDTLFTADNNDYYLDIRVYAGTFSNVKVYPMLRKADIADPTYEPYHETVEQCKFNRAEQAVLGAKNLLDVNRNDVTIENYCRYATTDTGVRLYTIQNSGYSAILIPLNISKNTDYKLTTYVDRTSGSARIQIRYSDDGSTWTTLADNGSDLTSDTNIDLSFNTGNHPYYQAKLYCTRATSEAGDINYTNLMLRLASDPDDTYTPYAMTNRELTDELVVNNLTVSVNSAQSSNVTINTTNTSVKKENNIVCGVIDFTVGNTDVSSWSNVFDLGISANESRFLALLRNVTDSAVEGSMGVITPSGRIQCGNTLSANKRYQMSIFVLI